MKRPVIGLVFMLLAIGATLYLRFSEAEPISRPEPAHAQRERRQITLQYLALSMMDAKDRSFIKKALEDSLAEVKDTHTRAVIAFLLANEGEMAQATKILAEVPETSLRNTFLYALNKGETLPLDWESWVGQDWLGAKISGMIYRRENREREYAQTLTQQRFYENRASVQQTVMLVASFLGYLGFGLLISMVFSNRVYRLAGKSFFLLRPLYFTSETFTLFCGGFFLALVAFTLIATPLASIVPNWLLSSLVYLAVITTTLVAVRKQLFGAEHLKLSRTLGLDDLRLTPMNLLQIVGGVSILVACLMAGASLTQLISWPFSDSEGFEAYRATLAQPVSGAVLLAFACFIAPAFEELLFRGIFMRGLMGNFKPWISILTSALLFAFSHSIDSWPFVFAMGVGLGIIYHRSGNLFVNIWIHAIYNGLTLILISQDLVLF